MRRSRREQQRVWKLWAIAWVGVLVAAGCGGGSNDSGPTGPRGPVTLFGSWQGSITATRADTGAQMTCTFMMNLVDVGDPQIEIGFGDWQVACPDGSMGGGNVSATRLILNLVLVSALQGEPFSGCGWGGQATLQSGRMTGEWETASDCSVRWTGSYDLAL